ncbi:MAG: CPBP family intramembrane glutamic endopeptidase [Balneolales bacterium]
MHIFDNPIDGRLRAGWRLLIQLIAFLFLLLFSSFFLDDYLHYNMMLVWVSLIATLSVWFAGRALDYREIREYGLILNEEWWKQFFVGFVLGGLAMAFIFIYYSAMGWVEFVGYGWERANNGNFWLAFIGYFLAMCSVGYYEELWTRGYQTRNLAEGLNYSWIKTDHAVLAALVVTSVVFGLLHMGNPHVTNLSVFVIILAGVLFAIPYVITGHLGMSIGLHISWNFFQGGIFGFPVSGVYNRSSILQVRTSGPEFWTGGMFGPEAGIMGLFTVLLLIALVIWYLKKIGYPLKVKPGFANWNRDHIRHNQRIN